MNPEKIIKYSVPVFVLAIISRSIEEISFFYYGVPVMCLFFIVQLFISSKFKVRDKLNKDIHTSGIHLPSTIDHPPLSPPEADFASLNIFSARGGFRFAQHLLRQRRISLRSTSSIIPLPFLLFLLPGLWFLLTSLWSSYPEVSATRALYFILISTGCISAGVLWIRYSERNIFELLLPANVIVVLICVFSILTNIPSDSWTGGHGKSFMGFFGHQNLLASVLLFTVPVMFVNIKDKSQPLKASLAKSGKIKGRKVFFFILLSLNLLVLALTYSRSVILALIFGVIVFLLLNKNWEILLYSFAFIAVITSIIYLTPAVNNFADKIIKKDFPEVYSSRLWMWEPSYKAAIEGGLFGLGYGISHPEIRSGEHSDRFEDGRLIREKGNSSLALIEESGLIGLILFMAPILLIVILSATKDHNQTRFFSRQYGIRMTPFDKLRVTYYSLLTAALAAFLLHAQFEAWWVGVGSVQLPLFFIYLGLLVNSSKFNSSKFIVYSSKFVVPNSRFKLNED